MRAKSFFAVLWSCCLVLLLASVGGCGSSDATRLRYDAEKLVHQAEKLAQDANIKQQLGDERIARQIRDAFGASLTSAYAALDKLDRGRDSIEYIQLSQIALRSASRLSQFFFAIRHYDTCTVVLTDLLNRLWLPPMETAATWVNLGQALQSSGQWDSAVVIYNKAIDLINPPIDAKGDVITPVFNLSVQMYRVYKRIGDSVDARMQYTEAISYYEKFARQRSETKLGMGSWAVLANLYGDENRWPEAIAALQQLKTSTGEVDWRAASRIADIYALQLREFDRAYQMYDDLQMKLTGQDTIARPVLIFKKALALLEQKQYERARNILVDLNRDYRGYFAGNPAPQYVKAKSFDLEGNWGRAETEYRYLIDNYTTSDQAMSTYLYLGEELAKRGRQAEAEKWMGRADEFYNSIATRSAGKLVEARAMTYRAELLHRKGDWTGTSALLLQIFDKFPANSQGHSALIAAAGIYRDKLGDPAKADSLIQVLRRVLTEPPDEQAEN